jgi:DNA-binding MarR family transcriptional regulator
LLWIAFHKIYRDEGKTSEISFTAGSILYNLCYQRMHMQDIARLNGVSKSTATDYIDNLEKKGYVIRVKDESDKRVIYIELTDKGKKWVKKNEDRILKYLEDCTTNLSGEELETFAMLFSRFMGGVDEEPFDKLFEHIMNMHIEK